MRVAWQIPRRMNVQQGVALGIVLFFTACSCDEPPAAAPEPAAATEAVPAEAAPTEIAERVAPTAPARPTLSDDAARRVRTAIREGRALAHDGHAVEALARFEEALALSPSPRLQCEAGFVAHLAENHERARELVDGALHVLLQQGVTEGQRVPLAMCLYNAGLVREAAGDSPGALDAFRRSLELRDNATVRQHLESLGGVETPASVVRATGATMASLDGVPALVVSACCTAVGSEGCVLVAEPRALEEEGERIELPALLETATPEGTEQGLEARTYDCVVEYDQVALLAVRVGSHVVYAPVGQTYNPGAFGVYGELELVESRYVDLVAGGALEVLVVVRSSLSDSDMAGCEFSDEQALTLFACTAEGDAPRCISVPLAANHSSGAVDLEGCEEMYTDGIPAREEESGGFALSYAIEGQTLVLTPGGAAYQVPSAPPLGAGTYPFADLFANAALRWPSQ